MNWVSELANTFKERDNIPMIGAVIGEVLEAEPLKVGILKNQIILDSSNSRVCNNLVETSRKSTVQLNKDDANTIYNNAEITYKEILKAGDEVLVISTEDNQNFFIVDKLR